MGMSAGCRRTHHLSTLEFDFIEDKRSSARISIMPRKKPMSRQCRKSGVCRKLRALLTLTKGLPLAYNRDLQEDKEPVFDTADTVLATLRLLAKLLPEIKIHREKMAGMAGQGFTLATDLADYLVRKGVPFRVAHHVVGQVVQFCIRNGKELKDCSLDEFKAFHKAFDADVFPYLEISTVIDRRTSLGGTATSRVKEAIARALSELDDVSP